ncbi:MAG: hypothetical protein ACRDRP_25305, partial [Pseudonocardiaceae bacterium]
MCTGELPPGSVPVDQIKALIAEQIAALPERSRSLTAFWMQNAVKRTRFSAFCIQNARSGSRGGRLASRPCR